MTVRRMRRALPALLLLSWLCPVVASNTSASVAATNQTSAGTSDSATTSVGASTIADAAASTSADAAASTIADAAASTSADAAASSTTDAAATRRPNRRDFIALSAAAAVGLGVSGSVVFQPQATSAALQTAKSWASARPIHRVFELPLLDAEKAIYVELRAGAGAGATLRMLVDSGAPESVITADAARRLGTGGAPAIGVDTPASGYIWEGAGGDGGGGGAAPIRNGAGRGVSPKRLTLTIQSSVEGSEGSELQMQVRIARQLERSPPGVDGVLGIDILRRYAAAGHTHSTTACLSRPYPHNPTPPYPDTLPYPPLPYRPTLLTLRPYPTPLP